MTTERDSTMTFCDGKYTLVRHSDGRMEALRYGEKWRDLTGDNLIAAMADTIDAHLVTPRDVVVSDREMALAAIPSVHWDRVRELFNSLASRKVAVPDAKGDPDDVPSWVKKCTDAAGVALYIAGWNACRQAMLASQDEVK